MSGAFQSMITKGATAKEALKQFMTDIAGSFAKMASDIAAKGIMKITLDTVGIEASSATASSAMGTAITTAGTTAGSVMGTAITSAGATAAAAMAAAIETASISSGIASSVGHDGGYAGMLTNTRVVSSSVFANAPKYHGGKGINSDEVALIAKKDELLVPGDQVVRAGGRQSAPNIIINNNTGRQFEASQPQFDGEKWLISIFTKAREEGGPLSKMMGG
jgi:hypothetical protein